MKWTTPRDGEQLVVRGRPTSFSFYPTFQGSKREGMHSTLFCTDPWNLILHQIERISDIDALLQANAFMVQARDFYKAALESDVSAAKPLLLYYSFLNLAKCFCVFKSGRTLGVIKHGISENLPSTNNVLHGHVSIDVTRVPHESAFIHFANALGARVPQPIAPKTSISIRSLDLFSQILVGHRIYCQNENLRERFINIKSINYIHNSGNKSCWIRVSAYADDFARHGYALSEISKCISINEWKNISSDLNIDGRRIIQAEMNSPVIYANRPSECLKDLSSSIKGSIWRSVTSYPPYREYYIYKPTPNQVVLNQLLSLYAATFYLGSITRYRPEKFAELLQSSLGPFVYEFFSSQPSQFIYLMATEFMGQEVARAAIT